MNSNHLFVVGGTGQIGRRLLPRLLAAGYRVSLLSRRSRLPAEFADAEHVPGDATVAGPWLDRLRSADAVINLAGESLFAKRWSRTFLETVRRSRVDTTGVIAQALAEAPRRADGTPKVLINGSAIGFYGPCGEEPRIETDPAGSDAMGLVSRAWEDACGPAEAAGVRVVKLRIGVVLDPLGGALAKMLLPMKLFVGGTIGSGRQFVSWIHHYDLTGLILFALANGDIRGPLNGTAPNPVTNREFTRTLGRVIRRPAWLWTPGFALRLLLGGVARLVTRGQRVIPQKALDAGYRFAFPELEAALRDLLNRPA